MIRAMRLGSRRLVLVLGKGGVGRTTIAAALARAAVARGRETLAVEVGGQSRLLELLGAAPGAEHGRETSLGHRLHGLSMDPARALEEYLVMQLPLGALARRLAGDRAFAPFAAAAPGMREVVTAGKLWYLTQDRAERAAPYDLVIADLPATGHGLALLRAPATLFDVATTGPLHRQAAGVAHDLANREHTTAVVVALPAELPVNEAISLTAGLRQTRVDAAFAVVNAVPPRLLEPADAAQLEQLGPLGEDLAEAARKSAIERASEDERRAFEIRRLARDSRLDVVELPDVAAPRGAGLLDLANVLAGAW
jgi:anion-transporting  ArsA/GET3 family ATPase